MARGLGERHATEVRCVEEGERRGGGDVYVDGYPARSQRPYWPTRSKRCNGEEMFSLACQDGL